MVRRSVSWDFKKMTINLNCNIKQEKYKPEVEVRLRLKDEEEEKTCQRKKWALKLTFKVCILLNTSVFWHVLSHQWN